MIEVYDEENREYFPMWSTDPGYTGGLNRWEHHAYQKALKAGKLGGRTRRDALRDRAAFLDKRQKSLSGLSFRDREEPIELLEAEERRLSGKRAANPGCAQVPELHIPTRIDGSDREDIPVPPPQTRPEETADANRREGAGDVRSDPSRRVADELGDTDALLNPSWDFSGGVPDDEDEED